MGYLIKSDVLNALNADKENNLKCYEHKDEATLSIVRECYESMEREIHRLAQYRPSSVAEITK